jgi:hypothetical protein
MTGEWWIGYDFEGSSCGLFEALRSNLLNNDYVYISLKMFLGSKVLPERRAENFTVTCEPTLENLRSSTTHNPAGFHSPLGG